MKHLLKLSGMSRRGILAVLNTADQMKFNLIHRLENKPLAGKTLAMVFHAPVPELRVSLETGMYQLGGQAFAYTEEDGMPAEETARLLSRYVDGIVVCCAGHDRAEEMAGAASVPVINAKSDFADPCGVLAALMTVREKLSSLENLKFCYIGPCGGFFNSLAAAAAANTMKIAAVCPEGNPPRPEAIEPLGDRFELVRDPLEAARDADVIYAVAWPSDLEAETRLIDGAVLKAASPEALVLLEMPARGDRGISEEVFRAHERHIYDFAENRLHVQKAVLSMLMGSSEE